MSDTELACITADPSHRVPSENPDPGCSGPVEYRESLTGTGLRIPRCDKHWADRLALEDELRGRYPKHPPADFDPTYAGERWDEDS